MENIMSKYQDTYRMESSRLRNWDYGSPGAYFVTICTNKMHCWFGDICDGQMQLSKAGIIANDLWLNIKNHTDNIELAEYVIMPNHVHGIILIKNNTYKKQGNSPTGKKSNSFPKISPRSGTLSAIIRSYKSAVSKQLHSMGYDFQWQTRFYDHIIHSNESYMKISDYILNNPLKWEEDELYISRSDTDKR
ncbi:MAG: transposase [Phycisphaerae bacterium]|nr:transposase [Phycisphaerae bacterium]